MRFGDFCNVKDQYDFISTLAFLASRRACCSTAVCTSQQTGNYTRQASREARRRAAVKPRPTSFPSGALRAYGAQGARGTCGLAVKLPPLGDRPRGSRVWHSSLFGGRPRPPFGDRPHCYKNDQRVFCTCWSFSFAAADTRRRWVLKVTKGNSSEFR